VHRFALRRVRDDAGLEHTGAHAILRLIST
jgi:hypothetical protein